jgi:tetratricopeptide (TPR) repeat protein
MSLSSSINSKLSLDEFVSELSAASTEEERSWLSLRFNLANQSEVVSAAVFAAAIPHWFDFHMLDFILGHKLSPPEYEILLRLPYVERYADGAWNVHEKTRSILRRQLHYADIKLFKRFSRKAAAWARKNILKSPTWRVEAVYHSLVAEEEDSVSTTIQTGVDFFNRRQLTELEALTRHILAASNDGLLHGKIVAWNWFFIGSMDLMAERLIEAESAVIELRRLCNGENRLIAESDFLLGQINMRQGHPKKASKLFESAIEYFEKSGRLIGKANSMVALGTSLAHLADLVPASKFYESAKTIFIKLKNLTGQANCESRQGEIAIYDGNFEVANMHFRQARSLYKKSSNVSGLANCLLHSGRIALEKADITTARKDFEKALEMYGSIGSDLGRQNVMRELGGIYTYIRHFDEADRLIQDALSIALEAGDGLSEANCLKALGFNCLESGKVIESREFFSAAYKIYNGRGYLFGELDCELYFVQIDQECDDADQAFQRFVKLLKRSELMSIPKVRAATLSHLAQYYMDYLNPEKTFSIASAALSENKDIHTLLLRSEAALLLGNFEDSLSDLDSAIEINPDSPHLACLKAKLKLWEGREDEAVEDLLRLVRKCDWEGEFYLWLAVSLAVSKRDFKNELEKGLAKSYRVTPLKRFAYQLMRYREKIELFELSELEYRVDEFIAGMNINFFNK